MNWKRLYPVWQFTVTIKFLQRDGRDSAAAKLSENSMVDLNDSRANEYV